MGRDAKPSSAKAPSSSTSAVNRRQPNTSIFKVRLQRLVSLEKNGSTADVRSSICVGFVSKTHM
jgi:hypothetical protein